MTLVAEPMKYHGPGWTIDGPKRTVIDRDTGEEYESSDTFQLWAPNDKRDHWSACWSVTEDNLNPDDGFFVNGDDLDDVLAPFNRPDILPYGDALRHAAKDAT